MVILMMPGSHLLLILDFGKVISFTKLVPFNPRKVGVLLLRLVG